MLIHKGEFTELAVCVDTAGRQFVRKTSFYPGSEKLVAEAEFIATSIPASARPFFPEVLKRKDKHVSGEDYYYDMPYYSGRLLRQKIMDEKYDLDVAVKDVEHALKALKDSLYYTTATERPDTFRQRHYVGRVSSRLSKYTGPKKSSAHVPIPSNLLTESQVEDFFRNAISRKSVTVNGRRLVTPLEVLSTIETDPKLKSLLSIPPESMRLIHGDPHFGNIMVRDEESKPLFFDPNGFHNGGDVAYDIGKFMLSLDYLDLLLEGELIHPQITWKNGDIQVGSLRSFKHPAKAQRLEYIFGVFTQEILPELFADMIESDPQLIDRSILAASIHTFACAHTFIPTKQKDAAIPLLLYYMERTQKQLEELGVSIQRGHSDG